MFTPEQELRIRELAQLEILNHMKVPAYSQEPKRRIVSKEFRGANAEQVESDINTWMATVGAESIHKIDSIKDPLSTHGVIKTIFVRILDTPTSSSRLPVEHEPNED